MEKVEEKQKSWKEKGRLYTREKGRRGKKEQEVSESIRTELTQDLIPSQEILYQLKEQEVSEPIWTEWTQDFMSFSKEILYQLLQLNFGQLHLKRLREKSREEKGRESEGWRR